MLPASVLGHFGQKTRWYMDHLTQAIFAILAITNPLGAAPIFLALTRDMSPSERRHEIVRATIAVVSILVGAALIGRWILEAFGVSVSAFQAAGGLIILLMGLEMLRGNPTRVQHDPGQPTKGGDPIMVPFAMPLIAGPGAITTVITLTSRGQTWQSTAGALIGIGVAALVLVASLVSSAWLEQHLRHHGHGVFLRFMGLILVAIGAQLLLSGIKSFGVF